MRRILTATAVLAIALAGCGGDEEPTVTSTASADGVVESDIARFMFEETITVPAGTTIRWTNQDSFGHTVTEGTPDDRQAEAEFEGILGELNTVEAKGLTYERVFDTPGTVTYWCRFHPAMIGTIVVEG